MDKMAEFAKQSGMKPKIARRKTEKSNESAISISIKSDI